MPVVKHTFGFQRYLQQKSFLVIGDFKKANESGGDFAKILLCYLNTGMNVNTFNRRPPRFFPSSPPQHHLDFLGYKEE